MDLQEVILTLMKAEADYHKKVRPLMHHKGKLRESKIYSTHDQYSTIVYYISAFILIHTKLGLYDIGLLYIMIFLSKYCNITKILNIHNTL